MLKVLFVIDTLETGGAEKSILAIVSHLKRFVPVVCSLYPGSTLVKEFKSLGVRVIEINARDSYNYFRVARSLFKVIMAEGPDIVHATLFRSEIITRLALIFCRNIILVGSLVGDTYNNERISGLGFWARSKLMVLKRLDRYTARRVDLFISISEYLKRSYISKIGLSPKSIVVIPRGRDVGQFAGNALRDRSHSDFVFVNVGRLVKLKGQYEIICAFSNVIKKYPGCKLLIAGEGPERNNLQSLISTLRLSNKAYLLGNIIEISDFLHEGDVFIFASHYEGQGGALVEAMLASMPIIASNIDVVREAIEEDVHGKLFKVKNTDSLFQQMIYAYENTLEMKELGERAREKAVRRYSIDIVVRQYEEQYLSIISNKNGTSEGSQNL